MMRLYSTLKVYAFFIIIALCLVLGLSDKQTIYEVYASTELTYVLGENVIGTLSSDGTLTISGSGDMYDYNNMLSESMSPLYSSRACDRVKKIVIEDGITSIGTDSINCCVYAREIVISGTVKSVSADAFSWNQAIENVIIQEGVEKIEIFAFARCDNLVNVELPSTLKEIDYGAFYGCFALEDIVLPESIEYIGEDAFGGCVSLDSITIPASVMEIDMPVAGVCANLLLDCTGENFIREYELENIYVSSENLCYKSVDGVVYSKDGTSLIWYPDGRRDSAYKVCDGTEIIGEYAMNNAYINTIELPESIQVLEKGAFSGAYVLEDINLPNTLTMISGFAFEACWKLDNVVVPENVWYVGARAFSNCLSLRNITFLTKNPYMAHAVINGGEISDYIFYECPEDLQVHTYKGSTVDEYMSEYTTENRVYDLLVDKSMNVDYRTEEEIMTFFSEHPISLTDIEMYEKSPELLAPYDAGVVSTNYQNRVLNMINLIRFIAGLDANVGLNEEYIVKAQTAALLNALNGAILHYPSQPSGMETELYQLGYSGANNSNLARGYANMHQAIINGWMYDGDTYYVQNLGHRRWMLNPVMQYTGIGIIDIDEKNYYTMYTTDKSNRLADEYGVAWPAQTMPIELFEADYPWSFSFGCMVEKDLVSVRLTNVNTKEEWFFSSEESNGEFYVDNSVYGQMGCIIFRPDAIQGYAAGDKYLVEISGLNVAGYEDGVTYEVNFFESGIILDTKVSEVTLNKTSAILTSKGATVQLTATVSPSDAANKNVIWKSGNTSVATVDANGLVTAVGNGTATITVITVSGSKTATCTVTVNIEKEPEVLNGWQKIDGKWYYYNTGGNTVKGWNYINNKWYYFNTNGIMQTGWLKDGGSWYYLNTDGDMATNWKKVNNKWYYFGTDGKMCVSWKKINNKWYYFNSDGDMVTGWKKVGTKWYYFNTDGDMQVSWKKLNNKWYYFNSDGDMHVGWKSIGGTWYYFNSDGDMHIGWKKLNGTWYYFDSEGAMVTGRYKINGTWNTFTSDGAWIG